MHNELNRAKILVIDDEATVLTEVSQTLIAAGYAVRTASDPLGAETTALSWDPDLIVSDINLGEESGLELCKRLRSLPGLEEIPVMFLSGAQLPNIVRRAHAAGGFYYVRKPFDHEVLLELVDKALWMPSLVTSHMNRV